MTTNTTPSFPPSRRDPRQVTNTLKRTLNFNDSDIAQFSFFSALPGGAFITKVYIEIVTAFNAGTTNPITVGTNSTTFNNIIASGDNTPGTPQVYSPALAIGKYGRSLAAAGDVAVFGTYIPTGTAPTTGQAVIVIEYEGGWAS